MTSIVNLTNYCSQGGEDINFIFVREPDSTKLKNVKRELENLYPLIKIDEIECDECFEINEDQLGTKKFIFVFEKFETAAFNHIAEIKDVYILGPKCVLSCINDKLEVPALSFQIFNLCMKGLHVTSSGIGDPERKIELKKRVAYMGGVYTSDLTEDVSHVVTEDVFSKKYNFAANQKLQILHPSWIDELWKLSQTDNFSKRADDDDLIEKYRLKIFSKLVFSSTGLETDQKKKLTKLIEDNGGEYSSTFKTSTVKVLLMFEKDIGSPKHKASVKHNIFCVDPKWIEDSVSAGYALAMDNYLMKKIGNIKSSTPTKNSSALGRFHFDNTMLSDISETTSRSIAMDETQRSSLTRQSSNFPAQNAKKDRTVTTSNKSSLRLTKTKSSDKSKTKDSTFKKPVMPKQAERRTENFAVPSPPKFDYTDDTADESIIPILTDKTVCVYGYTNDIDGMQVLKECEKLGAKLVDTGYTKQVDYIITSTEIMEMEVPNLKYKFLVTDVWLEESVELGRCIEPLKFYHHSIFKPQEKCQVLRDEIFVCSNYDLQRQRPFIRLLVRALGGVCKESLSRNEAPILICPEPEGKKFDGAKNWGLTVLRAEWLITCYKQKIRVDETDFIVGDTKISKRNIKKRDSIIPSSQDYVESDDILQTSPVRNQHVEERQPQTPGNDELEENENRSNLTLIMEDFPTPQRNLVRSVLMEQQKQKTKVSPRTKLLKDLMQTPANQKLTTNYNPSPAPELPQCLKAPEVDYALIPGSSPASQWYYKSKLDALDEQYVSPPSKSTRKALREAAFAENTPPESVRYEFLRKRLSDQAEVPSRMNVGETQSLYLARVTANMSKEASKFLNFEDTESEEVVVPEPRMENTDIINLDEIARKITPTEKRISRSNSAADDVGENQKIIDYDPGKHASELVRWSNTQKGSETLTEVANVDDMAEIVIEPIFAISSSNNAEEKLEVAEKIRQLGGKLTEINFTHLIMTKLTKSSKFFAALAAGKYVLHSSYIDECVQEQKFVNVEPFEYGNPMFKLTVGHVKEPLIAEGPYKCRRKIINNPEKYKNGLFTGMKFIILAASEEKLAQFACVIKAGGGEIIDEKPEFKISVLKRQNIDYCLVENLKSLCKKDLETLKVCDIQVNNIKFIHNYLLSDDS